MMAGLFGQAVKDIKKFICAVFIKITIWPLCGDSRISAAVASFQGIGRMAGKFLGA